VSPFQDREQAGRLLGAELTRLGFGEDAIVLALPRGGVPVGLAVANSLRVPLDVVVVRKLGVPWQPELAMGAIAGKTTRILDEELIREIGISRLEIDAVEARERPEVERQENLYRAGRPALDIKERSVVLVDDGLATGSTMALAARVVRGSEPKRLIIAVPVGSAQACSRLSLEADSCVCLAKPKPFESVGHWYVHFQQLSDRDVQSLLASPRPFK
jgi:putative phosphoribosyl transferase